ncbi:unnamed protein product [Prorocentrum cordatum]|uniref:C2H2-type domain-containing protein n=1 Tax=Prorocentrum cordatum TaxID=2364126 RepID=A0ABN9SCT3_9DINO|nr:unnamed protein product [Polarella glacialis]
MGMAIGQTMPSRPDCPHRHPAGRGPLTDGDSLRRLKRGMCHFGKACKRPVCWFQHPEGRTIEPPPRWTSPPQRPQSRSPGQARHRCRFSDGSPPARRGSPGSRSPLPRAAAGARVRQCFRGADCSRSNCPFDHPTVRPMWNSQAGKVLANCFTGYRCVRPNCKYQHPEGRVGPQPPRHWKSKTVQETGSFARGARRSSSRLPRGRSQDKSENENGGGDASDDDVETRSSSSERKKRSTRAKKKAKKAAKKVKKASKDEPKGRGRSASGRSDSGAAKPARNSASRSAGRSASSRSASRAAETARRGSSSSKAPAREASPAQSERPADTTFQAFVRDHVDGSATADEALAMWSDHSARRRFQLMKQAAPGLLSDLYHPHAVLRRLDLRLALARRRAVIFLGELRGGLYDGICLRASALQAEAAPAPGASECEVLGHLQPPAFALDPSAGTVLFRQVPAATSAWSTLEVLHGLEGLVDFSWSRPSPGEASPPAARDVLARFASPALAAAARRAAAPALCAAAPGVVPALLEPAARLRALVGQPALPRGRASADEDEVTQAVLGWAGCSEKKLDVQVTYLRRVHHFCFYSARWCEDAWDLDRNCGTVFLRGVAEEGEMPADGGWEEARERSIARVIREARLEEVELCEAAKREVVPLCQQQTQKVAEGRYRCSQCQKLFRGPEFVEKHLRRAHAELFEEVLQGAREEAMYRAFVKGERLLAC